MIVVMIPLMGFIHAYYIFGIYGTDLFRSIMMIYRLGFVGNFDLEEMEDIDGSYMRPSTTDPDDNKLQFKDAEFTKWHGPVALMILIPGTLLVTITMMNIFIAVLCEAYNEAQLQRNEIFWHTRNKLVLEEILKKKMQSDFWHWICSTCCRRRGSRGVSSALDQEMDDTANDWDYVWYCKPAQKVQQASDGIIDDEELGVSMNEEIEQLKSQAKYLKKSLRKFKQAMDWSIDSLFTMQVDLDSNDVMKQNFERLGVRHNSAPALRMQKSRSLTECSERFNNARSDRFSIMSGED